MPCTSHAQEKTKRCPSRLHKNGFDCRSEATHRRKVPLCRRICRSTCNSTAVRSHAVSCGVLKQAPQCLRKLHPDRSCCGPDFCIHISAGNPVQFERLPLQHCAGGSTICKRFVGNTRHKVTFLTVSVVLGGPCCVTGVRGNVSVPSLLVFASLKSLFSSRLSLIVAFVTVLCNPQLR